MAFDPVTFGAVAGASVLAPFISKGISSLFGLDEPSAQEREAAAMRQEAIARLKEQAEGKTASPAQLAALAQQQRTQQALAGMAQRGTVQQRAGNVRAAMQAAPEVMAQQSAIAAQTRAAEMESARRALAAAQTGVASDMAAAGREQRRYTQGLIGAGVQGIGSAAALGFMAGGTGTAGGTGAAGAATPTATEPGAVGTTSQGMTAQTAAPAGPSPMAVQTSVPTGALQQPSLNLGQAAPFEPVTRAGLQGQFGPGRLQLQGQLGAPGVNSPYLAGGRPRTNLRLGGL